MTFKQKVEEILTQQCGLDCEKVNENGEPNFCERCQTDRISAALAELADNLPSTLTSLTTGWDTGQYYEQVQAYLKKEAGK